MPRRLESLAFYLSANECLVEGEGSGVVMVDEIADRHHPMCDALLAGRVLVISRGRESDIDSAVMLGLLLEAIHAGTAPVLIVLDRIDDIIALGAIVAEEVLMLSVPVVVLDDARFAMAQSAHVITLHRGGRLVLSGPRLAGIASVTGGGELGHEPAPTVAANDGFSLSPRDRRDLDGAAGPAVQAALRIVLRMARLQGAAALVDVTRVLTADAMHTGQAGAAIAEQLVEWGGTVRVPTAVVESNLAPHFVTACRALGATPVDDSESLSAHLISAWPLALCVAITGRAPATPAG